MKILILGSTGYLGWQLYQFLKIKYTCFVPKRKNGTYDFKVLEKLYKKSNVIIFLSGQNFKNIDKVNIFDRKKILEKLIKKNDNDKFVVYFSTSAKLSKNKNKNFYVESHRFSEKYLTQKLDKKNYKIIKLNNVFGLRYTPKKKNISSSPANLFINDVIKGKPIILKTPNASRSWVTISNFLNLNEELILKKSCAKMQTKKMKIKDFLEKIYKFKKAKKLPKNMFYQEIVKTFSVLRKFNS